MANIQEVAQAAGVSTASVSRYLSGAPVRSSVAIARAIAELGYSPSVVARSLKSGRHGSIGVIVPDFTNPFFSALVKGIEQETRVSGYQVLLGNSDEDPHQEDALLAALSQRTDGIIMAPLVEEGRSVLGLSRITTPVVLVDRDVHTSHAFDRVLVDNLSGSQQAVDHLVSLGHTRIGFISGPLQSTPGRARHEGFRSAMAGHNLVVADNLVRISDFRENGGYQSMKDIWTMPDRPSAVFIANNLMTIGALNALSDLKVQVPRDISVIGFDDLSFAALLNPPLTAIRRPDIEQGASAARLLLGRILDGDESAPQSVTLPVELVVRGSTSAIQQRDGGTSVEE